MYSNTMYSNTMYSNTMYSNTLLNDMVEHSIWLPQNSTDEQAVEFIVTHELLYKAFKFDREAVAERVKKVRKSMQMSIDYWRGGEPDAGGDRGLIADKAADMLSTYPNSEENITAMLAMQISLWLPKSPEYDPYKIAAASIKRARRPGSA